MILFMNLEARLYVTHIYAAKVLVENLKIQKMVLAIGEIIILVIHLGTQLRMEQSRLKNNM